MSQEPWRTVDSREGFLTGLGSFAGTRLDARETPHFFSLRSIYTAGGAGVV